MLRSLTGLLGTKAAFAVTPKARGSAAPWQRLRFHFVVITLLVGVPFLVASYLFFAFICRFKAKSGQKAMYISGTEHQ